MARVEESFAPEIVVTRHGGLARDLPDRLPVPLKEVDAEPGPPRRDANVQGAAGPVQRVGRGLGRFAPLDEIGRLVGQDDVAQFRQVGKGQNGVVIQSPVAGPGPGELNPGRPRVPQAAIANARP